MKGAGSMFYLFSEATAVEPWYNGHRSLTVAPDEKRTFTFTVCRVKDYADINDKLYENGNIAVKIVPGWYYLWARLLTCCSDARNPLQRLRLLMALTLNP